jgi:hypothetical protein
MTRASRVANAAEVQKNADNSNRRLRAASYEYTATQAIAAAANFLEFDAMLVPSARFNTTNLVVFRDRIQTPPELSSSEEVDWAKWRASAPLTGR